MFPAVEALFNPKKLKRSERQKEKTDNDVDSPQKTAGTLTPKKQSKIDSCVNNNMVDLTNKNHTSLDTSLKCVNDQSDNVSDRQLKRRLHDNQKISPSDKQNQKHGKVEHSQEDLNNGEVDKSISDRSLRRQNKLNESTQGTDERHSQASPAKGKSKLKSKVESSQNNTDNEGSQSLLGSTECFVLLDEDQGIEIKQQLIDNTKSKYSFKKRTSAINEVQKSATSTENETKTDETTECHAVKIVNRDQLSPKMSSEEENANIGKEKGGSIDNETNEGTDLEEGLDSFDKMLLGHVRRSPRKRVNIFDDSDNESEKKARCDDVQTVSKESWQKDYSNYKKKKQKGKQLQISLWYCWVLVLKIRSDMGLIIC